MQRVAVEKAGVLHSGHTECPLSVAVKREDHGEGAGI